MKRTVILADGQRGKIFDVDTGESADVEITLERKQATNPWLVVGVIAALALVAVGGWHAALIIVLILTWRRW